MKIALTQFVKDRHWSKTFKGTRITRMTPEEFEEKINVYQDFFEHATEGYAPFCKLALLPNFAEARAGCIPITMENYQYLRSGYSSRTSKELPVLSRWFELPLPPPVAEWLMVVLYTREQLLEEHMAMLAKANDEAAEKDESLSDIPFEFDDAVDYGIVAIMAQMGPEEEPMKPMTMLRNALGKEEGGSGVPIDREAYAKSVEFWSTHATVRT